MTTSNHFTLFLVTWHRHTAARSELRKKTCIPSIKSHVGHVRNRLLARPFFFTVILPRNPVIEQLTMTEASGSESLLEKISKWDTDNVVTLLQKVSKL